MDKIIANHIDSNDRGKALDYKGKTPSSKTSKKSRSLIKKYDFFGKYQILVILIKRS